MRGCCLSGHRRRRQYGETNGQWGLLALLDVFLVTGSRWRETELVVRSDEERIVCFINPKETVEAVWGTHIKPFSCDFGKKLKMPRAKIVDSVEPVYILTATRDEFRIRALNIPLILRHAENQVALAKVHGEELGKDWRYVCAIPPLVSCQPSRMSESTRYVLFAAIDSSLIKNGHRYAHYSMGLKISKEDIKYLLKKECKQSQLKLHLGTSLPYKLYGNVVYAKGCKVDKLAAY